MEAPPKLCGCCRSTLVEVSARHRICRSCSWQWRGGPDRAALEAERFDGGTMRFSPAYLDWLCNGLPGPAPERLTPVEPE